LPLNHSKVITRENKGKGKGSNKGLNSKRAKKETKKKRDTQKNDKGHPGAPAVLKDLGLFHPIKIEGGTHRKKRKGQKKENRRVPKEKKKPATNWRKDGEK